MTKELTYYANAFSVEECPCCAGEPGIGITRDVDSSPRFAYIFCKDCGLQTKAVPISIGYSALDEAVKFWNRRDGM